MASERSPTAPRLSSSSAKLILLPADMIRRVAGVLDGSEAAALHLATGRAAPLASAFRAANELRRSHANRDWGADSDVLFRRWEALVVPLRCVVCELHSKTFTLLFRGAARRGIAALSALDASRLDLNAERQQRGAVSQDQDLDDAYERLHAIYDMPQDVSREEYREFLRERLPPLQTINAQFDSTIATLEVLGADLTNVLLGTTTPDAAIAAAVASPVPHTNGTMVDTWLARNSTTPGSLPGIEGTFNFALSQSILDACLTIHFSFSDVRDRPMQLGDRDVASVFESRRHNAFARSMMRKVGDANCMSFFRDTLLHCQTSEMIETDERLQTNLALQRRISAQRAWLEGKDADRKVARAKLAEGDRAHEAWLAATYAANPLRSMEAQE